MSPILSAIVLAPVLSATVASLAVSTGTPATGVTETTRLVVAVAPAAPVSLALAVTPSVNEVVSSGDGDTSTSAPRSPAPAVHTPGAMLAAASPLSHHPDGTPLIVTAPSVLSP